MEAIRNFRDIVNEEVSFKEARAISLDLLSRLSYIQSIMRGEYTFESNMNNTIKGEVNGATATAYISESFNVTFWYEGYDKADKVEVTFEIDMSTWYNYYADEKERQYKKEMNKSFNIPGARLVSLKLNGSEFKLDKKTKELALNTLKNEKIQTKGKRALEELIASIEKKVKIPSKEETLNFPEIIKAVTKAKENYIKEESEKLKKKNKEEYERQELEAKIAKKERVKANQVAAANDTTYIVFTKEGFDKEEARNLVRSYDCETWAIDRGYREAEERNERIIKAMGELGNGTFHYVTHPGGNKSEMEIKF